MGRLADMFSARKASGEGALMPFITAGYPSMGSTGALVEAIAASGADAIEIGIPFSDPIADGPVIAASMHEALLAGASPIQVFEMVSAVRGRVEIPLIAMVSISIVIRLGGPLFVAQAAEAGFDGLIVPDADLQGLELISKEARNRGIAFSTLVAPGASSQRIRDITAHANEFVYLLTRRGLTGESSSAPDLADSVHAITEVCDLPIAAGFGISTPEHVAAALGYADGAIVGSALVRAVEKAHDLGEDPATAVRELLVPLAESAHSARRR